MFPGLLPNDAHSDPSRTRHRATPTALTHHAVVVINEFMAKTHWPGEDAIGKRITIDDSTWVTVVGVAKNDGAAQIGERRRSQRCSSRMRSRRFFSRGLRRDTRISRSSRVWSVVRVSDAIRAAFTTPIVRAVREIDRNVPISNVQAMSSVADQATAESRFYLVLLAAFAAIALTLAAVGIYGVMSYSVSRRTHEIGIRIALGAEQATVLRFIVRQGMTVALVGAGAGLVAAFALTRLMGRLLFGVGPTDPATFAVVTTTLCAVALAASYLPARRATRVDPLTALRSD